MLCSQGDVLEKARELQEVRVIDWLEAEIVRLSHLRDRASEKGRKKELRECVEKLQLLKTPEERQRRLEEIPEVHADPKMDPSCESEDESEMDNRRQVSITRPRESGFFRRDRDHFSSRKGSSDSWSANARPPNKNRELNRNSSGKGFSSRREDMIAASQTNEHSWNNGVDKATPGSWEKPRLASDPVISSRAEVRSDISATASEASQPVSAGKLQVDARVNETEKIWHYRDPTGKVQGPFSLSQLRKWSNTGYFPADLRIWKASQGEDDSILLTEAMDGRFQKESLSVGLLSAVSSNASNAPSSVENTRDSLHAHGSEYGIRYDSSNLPSPTGGRTTAGWGGKQTSESKWLTSSPFRSNNQFQAGNERLPSPTPTSSSSVPVGVGRSNFSQQSKDTGIMGIKEENSTASVMATASVTNSAGQFLSTAVPRPAVSVNPGIMNAQQIPSQSAGHAASQGFAPADAGMNHANLRSDATIAAQGFSNVVQPGVMQNPSVYSTQGWAPGSVARSEIVSANMVPSNSSAVASQVPYGQWTSAPVANQASSYGAGYPPGPGNLASNFPAMPSQNAWRPTSTNMPWGGQPQQPMNPNMGWAEPPSAAAFGPPAGAMGQLAGATSGASAMPSGNTMPGWPGAGSAPTGGSVNPGWVAPSGNASTWGSDQNRRGSGGAQWNRHSSFGSGGGGAPGTPRGQGVCRFHENGHCKKGAACNYMHT